MMKHFNRATRDRDDRLPNRVRIPHDLARPIAGQSRCVCDAPRRLHARLVEHYGLNVSRSNVDAKEVGFTMGLAMRLGVELVTHIVAETAVAGHDHSSVDLLDPGLALAQLECRERAFLAAG